MCNGRIRDGALYCHFVSDAALGVRTYSFLLVNVFEKLAEGPTLKNLVSLAIMEKAIVLSGMGRIMLFQFQILHPGLNLDGFEDVLDREF